MAVPGDEVGRRLGESGGKGRGVHTAPNDGFGSPGGGRSWAVHGEGRPAVGLITGGGAPAVLGWGGLAGKLR